MPEIINIKASDLVLKVSEDVDPAKFNISKYEAFLDALCGTREFQKVEIWFEPANSHYRAIKGKNFKIVGVITYMVKKFT